MRYFTHVSGFGDGTVFIRVDNDGVYSVEGNKETFLAGWTLDRVCKSVTIGHWKEITFADAQKLLEPSKKKLIEEFLYAPRKRYTLVYRAKDDVKTYEISPPIEVKKDIFTVYVFGQGIKSFKVENVVHLS